jgi:rhodanese-related sulfurtransferase
MHKRRLQPIVLIAVLLLVIACNEVPSAPMSANGERGKNADGYTKINAVELAQTLRDTELTLVNVHIPYAGDLPETDLSIPYNEIAAHLDQLPELDAPVVVYCLSGGMSTAAAKELVSQGYTNIVELEGGMRAWVAAGYELAHK